MTTNQTNTQIVATIGPSSKEVSTLIAMFEAGLSVARLNFSWGTRDEHRTYVAAIQMAAGQANVSAPIIQDLSGPRVQTGAGHTLDSDMTVITDKDICDIQALADLNIEYVALSFVKDVDDIAQLRRHLADARSTSKVIAKIERPEALQNLDDIIAAADGIMIARGDLGDAVPYATLPFIKKDILRRCNAANTPAIVATDMLSSMVDHDKPSRADVSDIAHAVLDGASATMLSNETATGAHPVKAVEVMRTVVDEAGRHTKCSVTYF